MIDVEPYRELLTPAINLSRTHTFDDIKQGLERGEFQLWPGEHSAVITQLQTYPQRRVLCVFAAAGKLPELKSMWPAIKAWATAQGCRSAFLVGRAGWARSFLQAEGWEPTALVMETDL